jgi:flagellar motor switch protein FliN/FliY
MAAIAAKTPLDSFLETICQATSVVLSRVFNAQWSLQINSDSAGSPQTSSSCFRLTASAGLQGDAWIEIGTPGALLLAQKFLGESPDPTAKLNQKYTEALKQLLGEVSKVVSTSLKSKFGEVGLQVTEEKATGKPPTLQGPPFALLASEGSSPKLTLGLRLSPELETSVSSGSHATSDRSAESGPTNTVLPHEPNVDLLLGVTLNLTLRFGRRVLPLRDIVDLTSGSVVELDQEVQEPADLLLGDKLIARGQVVIVDGNYGLQVTEVVDARQRVGTL